MKPVTFHPDAEVELDKSIAFYEKCEPGLGLDFERDVAHGILQIQEAPLCWPVHKYGLRKYLIKRFPFHIFYLILPECIWIVAVAHCSRKPDYWKNRIS